MYYEMTVYGFAIDDVARMPVAILKDADEERSVPVWISSLEALAIASELINRELASSRGTEDLMSSILARTGMSLERVSFDELHEGTFKASAAFLLNDNEIVMDIRPVDALVLSLKYKKPLLVEEEVVSRACGAEPGLDALNSESDARRFVDFLEKLDPSEMGKYPM